MTFAPTDTLFDTVLDFLASTPTPEQIIAYEPPEVLQKRLSELLAHNRSGGLSDAEQTELDEFLRMNRFMSSAQTEGATKARLMSLTYISPQLRRAVVERAGNCCEYCRSSQSDQFFTYEVDHIIAEKHGGQTLMDNLCLACPDWKAYKGSDIASIDWETGGTLTALYNPRQDAWDEHFQVDPATGHIEARTSIGRVTISLMRLNDPDRMMDRKLLIDARRYPCVGQV